MLRVRKSDLGESNGKFVFDGIPFFGIVYAFDNNGVLTKLFKVKNGEIVNDSDDELGVLEEGGVGIDGDFVDDESDDFVFFNETRFSGVCYDFNISGTLEEETVYSFGEACLLSREWFSSGEIKRVTTESKKRIWNQDGSLKYFRKMAENGDTLMSVSIDSEQCIERLSLDVCSHFDDDQLNGHSFARNINLSGDGIDIKIIEKVLARKNFESIDVLTLSATSLNGADLMGVDLNVVFNIAFSDNPNITEEDIFAIKKRYKNTRVRF